jgi:hypothetical protein
MTLYRGGSPIIGSRCREKWVNRPPVVSLSGHSSADPGGGRHAEPVGGFLRKLCPARPVPASWRRNTPSLNSDIRSTARSLHSLAWTAANADAVRLSQAEFDRSRHMDDVT